MTPESSSSPIVAFTVPMLPPSANSYVRHTRAGGHYKTDLDKRWMNMLLTFANGRRIRAKHYEVSLTFWQPPKKRGDVDNLIKRTLDALQTCGVIDTDAKVARVTATKMRGAAEETHIEVTEWAL